MSYFGFKIKSRYKSSYATGTKVKKKRRKPVKAVKKKAKQLKK
jgi:hypothetical protein